METIGKTSIKQAAVLVLTMTFIGPTAGCPPKIPPFDPGTVKPEMLPRNVPKLLTFAQKRLALGRAQGFHRLHHADALVALDKARSLAPRNLKVLLLGARVARRLGERSRSGHA